MEKPTIPDNQDQIIRKDARGCFVEVKNDCFHLDKVHLQFVTYDQKRPPGQRYTNNVHIYISIPEFLVLAKEAETGALHVRMQQMKREGKTEPLFEHLGGTSAVQLRRYGKERKDGMSLSRIVKLVGGNKTDYLFVADSGPGEQSGKGLIVPRFGKAPEQHMAVSLNWRAVNEAAADYRGPLPGVARRQISGRLAAAPCAPTGRKALAWRRNQGDGPAPGGTASCCAESPAAGRRWFWQCLWQVKWQYPRR